MNRKALAKIIYYGVTGLVFLVLIAVILFAVNELLKL